jgi:trypsin
MKRLSTIAVLALSLAGCLAEGDQPDEDLASAEDAVVLGTLEPSFRYPWVVDIDASCKGVLVDAGWVLTAAHCIATQYPPRIYHRYFDPATGQTVTEYRDPALNSDHRGIFVHPDYNWPDHDVALVRLESPFVLDRHVQKVALPRWGTLLNQEGVIANHSHTMELPPGLLAIFRAPIVSGCPAGQLCVRSDNASLCPGDSGSGFVMQVDGRAVVEGIASWTLHSDCATPGVRAGLADVWANRAWILATIGKSADELDGRVRLRWAGRATDGTMRVSCIGPFGLTVKSVLGAMNAPGAELGLTCPPTTRARVRCDVSGAAPYQLADFKLETTSGGDVTVETLAFGDTVATHEAPASATAIKEYTCTVTRLGLPPGPVENSL